jgi:UDP-GlcNAc:undecaprenyl-phosphate GlcNAc-1-phosphate transferase
MGIGDLVKLGMAIWTAVAASYSLIVIRHPPGGTMSFFFIDCLLLGLFTGTMRSAYRILDYSNQQGVDRGGAALIYGAGRGGQLVLRELLQNKDLGMRPIGFIDDDPKLANRTIGGLPILGTSHDIPAILDNHLVTSILISSKSIKENQVKTVVQAGKERGVNLFSTGMELHPIFQSTEPLHQPTVSTRPAA